MVQEAIANLEYLVEIRKGSPLVRAALGKAHLKIQNYEPALEQFRRALSANENYADLHFYCGVCEYYLQHCSAAVHSFSRAIKINPHYGEAYVFFSLALLLNFKLGQEYGLTTKLTERTQKAFQRARAILPSLGGADFDKGIALLEHEKFEEAFGVFEPWISKISSDKPEVINYEFHLAVLHEAEQIPPERVWQEIIRLQNLLQRYPNYADVYYELGFAYAVLGSSVTSKSLHHFEKAMAINPDYENARKGLKLIQNDQRGLRTMLQAMLPIRATLNHEQKS
jgi:tetratricopeptide (TPR) repeat protein